MEIILAILDCSSAVKPPDRFALVPTFQRLEPPRLQMRERDDRPRGSSRKRGYSAAWDRLAARWLRKNPLCRWCDARNCAVPAVLVDHILPVRDFPALRLQTSNVQSLCRECHGLKTRMEAYARGRGELEHLVEWSEHAASRPLAFRRP